MMPPYYTGVKFNPWVKGSVPVFFLKLHLSALTARSPELLLCGVSVVEEVVPPNVVVTIVVGVRT